MEEEDQDGDEEEKEKEKEAVCGNEISLHDFIWYIFYLYLKIIYI